MFEKLSLGPVMGCECHSGAKFFLWFFRSNDMQFHRILSSYTIKVWLLTKYYVIYSQLQWFNVYKAYFVNPRFVGFSFFLSLHLLPQGAWWCWEACRREWHFHHPQEGCLTVVKLIFSCYYPWLLFIIFFSLSLIIIHFVLCLTL